MAEKQLSINSTKNIKLKAGNGKTKITWELIKSQKELIFMSFPFLIYIFIFAYAPLWGWLMSFQFYRPGLKFFEQEWVGFDQFKFLFTDSTFMGVLRNTIGMSLINLVLGFVTAIALALLLNEIRGKFFKRTIQTISYLPHFLSWVVAASLITTALSTEGGIINIVLMKLNIIDTPVLWLGSGKYFWGIIGASNVWKEVGWNTIIYLAAIASIDPALYEAADMDGAGRFRKMFNITLPSIKPTIMVLLIMNIGHILDAGFEAQYLIGNSMTMDWSDTIDIFVLKYGIQQFNYSFATAAGMFKSVVNISLLLIANFVSSKFGEEQLL